MREIRLSGSEGGGTLIGSPYPYQNRCGLLSRIKCDRTLEGHWKGSGFHSRNPRGLAEDP